MLPPAPPSPQTEPEQGPPRYIEVDRKQVVLLQRDWEGLVGPDHLARAIWSMMAQLDWSEYEKRIKSRDPMGGRPCWSPQLLASVWIYVHSQNVGSAREAERMMDYEPGLQWLAGGKQINYHTLADFRVCEKRVLDRIMAQVLAVLDREGMIDLSVVMQDGTKVKASAGSGSMHRRKTLEEHLEQAQQVVEELGRKVGDPDDQKENKRKRAAKQRAAREREGRMKAALKELDRREAQARPKQRDQVRVSESESEVVKMKHADGGYAPSYNVQVMTESSHSIVVGIEVSGDANDSGALQSGVQRVEKNTGRKPGRMVGDNGYATRENVEAMAKAEVEFVAPWKEDQARQAGALKRNGIDAGFGPAAFVEQPEGKSLQCPAGKQLEVTRKGMAHGLPILVYEAKAADCQGCEHKSKCCPRRKSRQVRRVVESPAMLQYLERMKRDEIQELYKQRKKVAEFPHLWMKAMRRWDRFQVRGKAKAAKEAIWRAVAYNIEQWTRVCWRVRIGQAATA
jgi:transposase